MKRKKNHDQNPTTESGSQHKASSPPETSISIWNTQNVLKVLSPQPQWCHNPRDTPSAPCAWMRWGVLERPFAAEPQQQET